MEELVNTKSQGTSAASESLKGDSSATASLFPLPTTFKITKLPKLWFYRQKRKVLLSSTAKTRGPVLVLIKCHTEFSQGRRHLLLKEVGVLGILG